MSPFRNKTRYLLFFLCVIAFNNSLKAQQELGIKAGMGVSKMQGTYNKYTDFQKWEYASPSYQVGVFYNYPFNKKMGIGAELTYSNIASKHSYQKTNRDSANNIYFQQTTHVDYHLSYLTIPIHFYYQYKKVTLNVGVQQGIFLNGINKQSTTIIQSTGMDTTFVSNNYKMDKYTVGIKAGLVYKINNILSVEANYWMYNTKDEFGSAWKVHQVIFGLRYKIYPKTACATCPGGF